VVLSRVALALLAAAPGLAGCNQSLFDSSIGGDAARIDSSVGDDDASPIDALVDPADADTTDSLTADADGPLECPAVCIADLVEDYDGHGPPWRYLSDHRDNTFVEMTAGTYIGLDALVGDGDAPVPSLVDCRDFPGDVLCQTIADRILMAPSAASAGHHDPAVEVAIDDPQQYRISGAYTSISTTSVVHDLRIYRNSLQDLLFRSTFDIDASERSYAIDAEMMPGDRLLLGIRPQTGTGTPLGLEHFVSRNTGAFPGRCGVTVRMESITGAAPAEDCGLITYTARADDGGGGFMDLDPVPTVAGPTGMGTAISLAEGQYLLPAGGPMNYSASFTIQMWVRVETFNFPFMDLWADWHDTAEGGINMAIDDDGTLYATALTPGGGDVTLSFAWPTDMQWHFVRLVRNAGTNTFRVCLDGQQRSSMTLSGALDLTSDEAPFIGRNVTYNPPTFIGEIDDVRMFTRALPCP
jgi:hypothetical protein